MMALSGVRSSCDMLARNSDLWRFAASICRLLSLIYGTAGILDGRDDWVAKVFKQIHHFRFGIPPSSGADRQGRQ